MNNDTHTFVACKTYYDVIYLRKTNFDYAGWFSSYRTVFVTHCNSDSESENQGAFEKCICEGSSQIKLHSKNRKLFPVAIYGRRKHFSEIHGQNNDDL